MWTKSGSLAFFIVVCCALLSTSAPASAAFRFCSAPFAPTTYINKPSKPYCAASRSCERWEVDAYEAEVDRYFDKLRDYLADVDRYRSEAYDYAKCMADLD